MMRRLALPFATIGWLAAVVGAIGGTGLRIVDPAPLLSDALGFGDVSLVGFELLGLSFASVGALLVVRRPENAVGWVMVQIGAAHTLAVLTSSITASAVADGPAAAPLAGAAAWFTNLFTMAGALVLGIGFIFPTGRGHTPGWDRFVRIGFAGLCVLLVLVLIRPGPFQVFATINNPIGFGPDTRSIAGVPVATLMVGSPGLSLPLLVWSIASRYRQADRTGRQQLKWFILALLVAVGGFALAGISAMVGDEPPAVGLVVFAFAGTLVPVAIGIAILRHNLYDIDRLISRTISYAAVTVSMGVIFTALLLSLTGLMTTVAGGETIAAAASTLTAYALFQPIRRRVQRTVDRRFNRARVDAERMTEAFATRLRDQLDLLTLTDELRRTAASGVEPVVAGVWLRRHRAAN